MKRLLTSFSLDIDAICFKILVMFSSHSFCDATYSAKKNTFTLELDGITRLEESVGGGEAGVEGERQMMDSDTSSISPYFGPILETPTIVSESGENLPPYIPLSPHSPCVLHAGSIS